MHFCVRNPAIIKSKGRPRVVKNIIPKIRKCGHCREVGHMRNKCPKLAGDTMGHIREPKKEDSYTSNGSTVQQSFTCRDSYADMFNYTT